MYRLTCISGRSPKLPAEKALGYNASMNEPDLEPGKGIRYERTAGTAEEQARFLEVVKLTWQLLPSDQRTTIYDYYYRLRNSPPVVRFQPLGGAARAGRPIDDFLIECDSATILSWPDGEQDASLIIAHELAHCFCFATFDKAHYQPQPNPNPYSPESLAWDGAREEAANKVLAAWPFFDPARMKKLEAAVFAYATARRKGQVASSNP
jgi:hypothetical protein